MKRLIAGALTVVVIALSACGNDDEPIDVMTPTPWGTPYPTASTAIDPVVGARAAYERYSAELSRVLQAGGADQLGPALLETTADDHQVTVLQLLRTVKVQRIRSVGASRITIVETLVESPEQVRLHICEDTTRTRWVDEAGNDAALADAKYFETESVLRQTDSQWKIVSAETTRLDTFSDSPRCQNAS